MIEVLYSCQGCGIKDAKVEVPERAAGEIVTDWLHTAQIYLGNDHTKRSPLCGSQVCDLKIPLAPGSDRIGEPTKQ